MRLIDAEARVTVQSFDPMNEEYDHAEMSVEQALNFSTDEGCPQVVDAITVEWLKQQFYDNPNSQWAEKCRDVFTGWQKWQRLQKEHENLQEAIKQWKKYCKDYTNNHGLSYYGCMFEINGSCNSFPKEDV